MIYIHSGVRQDDLSLVKFFEVKDWSMMVNSSLLGICVTDAYLLYRGAFGSVSTKHGHDFFYTFDEKLIDNTYDVTGIRQPLALRDAEDNFQQSSSTVPHLILLKSPRRVRTDRVGKARFQRKHRHCSMKCTY